jgi:hypothetical protein
MTPEPSAGAARERFAGRIDTLDSPASKQRVIPPEMKGQSRRSPLKDIAVEEGS